MKEYRAIIIDDERNIREALELLLKQYCPDIELVGSASSAEEGCALLKIHQVDFTDFGSLGAFSYKIIYHLPRINHLSIN